MNFIPTTATAVEKLKRLAKQLRNVDGISLAAALDRVAQTDGYASWKHVIRCLEQSKSLPRPAHVLPPVLTAYLERAAARAPPSTEASIAFKAGLVFAMHAQDVDGVVLDAGLVECDEAWTLAAGDLWNVYVHAKDHDQDIALVDELESAELLEAAQEELMSYRLVRYCAADVPTTLEDAFARVMGRFFFPPRYVWLLGRFIDMQEVREVRVAGRVVYSCTAAYDPGKSGPYASPGSTAASSALAGDPPAAARRRDGFIPSLDIKKLQPALYEYRLSHGGQEMFTEAGFASISEAIEHAADITGDILGFEVSYGDLSVGTYPLAELRTSAESIALRAVQTVAALRGD